MIGRCDLIVWLKLGKKSADLERLPDFSLRNGGKEVIFVPFGSEAVLRAAPSRPEAG